MGSTSFFKKEEKMSVKQLFLTKREKKMSVKHLFLIKKGKEMLAGILFPFFLISFFLVCPSIIHAVITYWWRISLRLATVSRWEEWSNGQMVNSAPRA
ncbi:hypothetical protein [Bacillus sp. PK30]|uniref:hypothetical protein n=1 Tax=Bacillus sp. PK30 TaxID=2954724 RepID=UPI0030F8D85F